MKKIFPVLIGVALVSAAPLAAAFPDPLYLSPTAGTFPNDTQSRSLQPAVTHGEFTFYSNVNLGADQHKGIHADAGSREFWDAGTSGVSPN